MKRRTKLVTQRRVMELFRQLTPEQKQFLAGVMTGMTHKSA